LFNNGLSTKRGGANYPHGYVKPLMILVGQIWRL